MPTPTSANKEIGPSPPTHTPTPGVDLMDPSSAPTKDSQSLPGISSPKRSRLFEVLRSWGPGRKSRGGSESHNSQVSGRRKSTWGILASLRNGRQTNEENLTISNATRARSASLSKKGKCDHEISPTLQRRKSLGNILGILKHQASSTRSANLRDGSEIGKLSSALIDSAVHQEATNVGQPISATHPNGATTQEISIQLVVPSYGDVDGCTDHTKSMVNGRSKVRTLATCQDEAGDKLLVGDEDQRSKTLDDYLCALIEAHCTSLDTSPTMSSQMKSSIAPAPNALKPARKVTFVEDACSDLTRTRESLAKKTPMGDIGASPDRKLLDTPKPIEDNEIVRLQVAEPEFYFRDLDRDFIQRSETRNQRYQTIQGVSDVTPMLDKQRIEQSVKLTVARMTKNFHNSNHNEGQAHCESSEIEAWNVVFTGSDILHKKFPYTTAKRVPSQDHSFHIKTLEETTSIAKPFETKTNHPLQQISSRTANLNRVEANSTQVENQSPGQGSLDSRQNRPRGQCVEQLKIRGKQPRRPCSNKARHVSLAPVFVEFPQVNDEPLRRERYSNKSDAISDLYNQSYNRQYSSFCTYDPRTRTIHVHPRPSGVPNLPELRSKGKEILWLPMNDDSTAHFASAARMARHEREVHDATEAIATLNSGAGPRLEQSNIFQGNIAFKKSQEGAARSGEAGLLDKTGTLVANNAFGCTYFPSLSPLTNTTPNSSLSPDTPTDQAVQPTIGNGYLAGSKVGRDIALSFVGSQFSGPKISLQDDESSNYEFTASGTEVDLLFGLKSVEETRCTKTWFDLAKDYLAEHPKEVPTKDSENEEVGNDGLDATIGETLGPLNEVNIRGDQLPRPHPRQSSDPGPTFEHIENITKQASSSRGKVESNRQAKGLSEIGISAGVETNRYHYRSSTSQKYTQTEPAPSPVHQPLINISSSVEHQNRIPKASASKFPAASHTGMRTSSTVLSPSRFEFSAFAAPKNETEGTEIDATRYFECPDQRIPHREQCTPNFDASEGARAPSETNPDDLDCRVMGKSARCSKFAKQSLELGHKAEIPLRPRSISRFGTLPDTLFRQYGTGRVITTDRRQASEGPRYPSPSPRSFSTLSDADTENSSAFGEALERTWTYKDDEEKITASRQRPLQTLTNMK
ncbi:uncharacterized protein BP5553_07168 [Venustampulla echinocandica]|uniref:Uncharacterized protein n=1 Tax=Venustampulla echinocandica TaxID=2656787 RepID=A0A370TIR1_9HELO|nr:uncharacterized protein BP5553_07168 [Venustampulla echinocandica]RDL35237.1 hypothetical protein BP5553_07168 [Venustampulla echinocandica]